MEIIDSYIMQIVKLIIFAIVALFAGEAKKLWSRYVNSDIKRNVVRIVVRAVEQIYTELHGNDKLHMAMQRASSILLEYGIQISDYELISLIEAAVNEFNNTFHKDEEPDQLKPPDESKWDKPFDDTDGYGMTD